jgi:hypothetical protein
MAQHFGAIISVPNLGNMYDGAKLFDVQGNQSLFSLHSDLNRERVLHLDDHEDYLDVHGDFEDIEVLYMMMAMAKRTEKDIAEDTDEYTLVLFCLDETEKKYHRVGWDTGGVWQTVHVV